MRAAETSEGGDLSRPPGFLGIMNPENDAVYLPLKKGTNELMLAISELGGGGVSSVVSRSLRTKAPRHG
jgi:hypothetical protein